MDWAQYFPDRYDDPRYEVPKYILVWGKDPLYSSPDGLFGHSVVDLMKPVFSVLMASLVSTRRPA